VILRCKAPRKKDRLRECEGFAGAAPDGVRVRRIGRSSEAVAGAYVLGCVDCGALYEVIPPHQTQEAA
jgi:hypothetical protein